ncbi:MAG: peptidase C39 family protein [Phycisphaerae bacterium]|jgi:hypothetical protein|nr:peptidase C39 family protein [Phycisphaerae bacterium]HOO15700.1 peptidase C39 family protein [Phycisphaerae bacterium]HPC21934.1 peptidase C39 family protein [Phycisphaerae bacterium]HRS28190.1 peptidase C39 family protein [Phycisphaerae bacterium]
MSGAASQPQAIYSFRHELIRHDSPALCQGGVFESPTIAAQGEFNEALLSWNVDVEPGTSFCVELRVGRRRENYWTPYLHLGDWGPAAVRPRLVKCDSARVDVDILRSDERFDRAQYRVIAQADGRPAAASIRHVTLCLSERLGPLPGHTLNAAAAAIRPGRLPVPFRSQRAVAPDLAPRICSPTSLAMVMQYRGVNVPTETVAAACYDPAHDIYGNWPRNIQAAYAFGVSGYLARFSDLNAAAELVAAGQPLIISIRFSCPGALRGAPYLTTDGHLLVCCGFDASGDVYVNDPAAATDQEGCTIYDRQELEEAWLRGGGVAYVLLPTEPSR